MYIKQVTIERFKTFRNKTIIGPFHPQVNIVVGINGSGKTNLFTAIQFIFSEEYAILSKRQIDSLTSKRQGQNKDMTSVEIVFDNSNKILNIDKTEITIKRRIKNGTSQFFFNGKSISSRKVLIEMLSSSSISFFGNFFMVKQGNINEIAVASDEYRLKILLEMTGVEEYKIKMKANQCVKENTTTMFNKMQQKMERLMKHQVLLEKEYHDIEEFHDLEGKKRLIEYTIATKKLEFNEKKMEELAKERDQLYQKQAENVTMYTKTERQLDKINLMFLKKTEEFIANVNRETELKCDLSTLEIEEKKIKAKMTDLQEEIKEAKSEKKSIERKLKLLNKEINSKLLIIKRTNLNLDPIEKNIEKLKNTIVQEAEELEYLYSKKQRIEKYSNKKARNKSLRDDIRKLEELLEVEKRRMQKVQADYQQTDLEKLKLENKIKDTKEKIKQLEIAEEDRIKNLKIVEDKLEQIVNNKKILMEEEHKLEEKKRSIEMNFAEQCKQLEAMVQEPIILGKKHIEQVLESFKDQSDKAINGYHGFVIDCFKYDKEIDNAVEAVANKKLFRYVFNNHQECKTVMDELKDKKLLSGTDFVALNRVPVYHRKLPPLDDTTPLINHLKYDIVYDKLMRSLFGNVLVCKNFKLASKISSDKKIVCVTVDGDVSYSSGIQVGGYIDDEESYIKIYKSLMKVLIEKKKIEVMLEDCCKKRFIYNNIIDHYCQKKIELNNLGLKHGYENDQLKNKLPGDDFMLERIASYTNKVEEYSNEVSEDFRNWTKKLEKLKEELEIDFIEEMTAEDQQRIEELKHSKMEMLLKEEESKKAEIEKPKIIAEFILTGRLNVRDQLQNELKKLDIDKQVAELAVLKNELTKIKTEKYEEKLRVCEEQSEVIENLKNELETLNDKKKELEQDKKKLAKDIDSNASEIAYTISKYQQAEERIKEIKIEIDEIACLPSIEKYPEFHHLTELLMKELRNHILQINKELQKFPKMNINIKSEYITLNKSLTMVDSNMEYLIEQKVKLNKITERIEQVLMNAVHQMFKTVNQNFKETFQRLMPGGDAEMIIITTKESYHVNEVESVDNNEFIGIRIDVALTRGQEMKKVNELSGGQKTLVALALIFGFRNCCPAPFYLFDEIDQALDDERRQIVGEIIKEMSLNAQLIITTHRSELLKFGNKFFRIQCQNSISRVVNITHEEASNFIEGI